MASPNAPAADAAAAAAQPLTSSIPVTMLSGFLGAGAFEERDGEKDPPREREREETKARSEHKLSLFFSHLFPSVKKTSTLNQLSFLGKTTVLRHLLQNSSHLRIGCVVNDVADVNIDAKLVRNDRSRQRNKNNGNDGEEKGGNGKKNNTTADLADTIELANGCACCSIQDELFGSFEQLLSLADAKGASYDR